MSTYREIIYMVFDELKTNVDDQYFEEEHILFLMDKYRAFLLKQRYADIKKQMSERNLQSICFDLMEVPAIAGIPCSGGSYLKTTVKIPVTIPITQPVIYPTDYYQGNIAYVSRDRMRYVGYNKFLQNIIYASLGPDHYLYFKSQNPQYLHLEKARMSAVFEDTKQAFDLRDKSQENPTQDYDIRDSDFPLEDALIPPLIELIVKELLPATYRPKDEENNSADNLSRVGVK